MQTCKTRRATEHSHCCSNCPDADVRQHIKCTHCSRSAVTTCTVSTLELPGPQATMRKVPLYPLCVLTNRTWWSIIQGGLHTFNTGHDLQSFKVHCLLPEGASSAVDTTLLHWLHKMHLSRKSVEGLFCLQALTLFQSGFKGGRIQVNLPTSCRTKSKQITIIPNGRNIWLTHLGGHFGWKS